MQTIYFERPNGLETDGNVDNEGHKKSRGRNRRVGMLGVLAIGGLVGLGFWALKSTRVGLEMALRLSEAKQRWQLSGMGVTERAADGEVWGFRQLDSCGDKASGSEASGGGQSSGRTGNRLNPEGGEQTSQGARGYPAATHQPGAGGEGSDCTCVALIHGLGDQSTTFRRLFGLIHSRGKNASSSGVGPIKWVAWDLPGSPLTPIHLAGLAKNSGLGSGSDRGSSENPLRVRKLALGLLAAMNKVPDCRRWVAVGNSLGGWIAQWMALEQPERVSRLVLLNSAGLKNVQMEVNAGHSWASAPTVESLKDFQARAFASPRPLSELEWQVAVERQKVGPGRAMLAAQVVEDYLEPRLQSLHTPTLVFWGESDRVIPIEEGRKLWSLIPGAIWRSQPACGHLPQKECPEAVLEAIDLMLGYGAS